MMERKGKDLGQEKLLLRMYSSGTETDIEEFLGGTRDFLERIKSAGETPESILHEAAVFIEAFSQFKEVSIAAKGHDGMYRYIALIGYTKEAEEARKRLSFTLKEINDISVYRPLRICRISQYHLSERKPYRPGDENTFNKPNLLGMPRQRPDDMVEGDYLEMEITGKNREILGWIEVSGTPIGRLPKRDVIIQMEFFATCLSLVLNHILSSAQHQPEITQ